MTQISTHNVGYAVWRLGVVAQPGMMKKVFVNLIIVFIVLFLSHY